MIRKWGRVGDESQETETDDEQFQDSLEIQLDTLYNEGVDQEQAKPVVAEPNSREED